MTDEEKNIQRNKIIITIAVLSMVFVLVGIALLRSTVNDEFYFHQVHNRNTGEPIGVIGSILLYILLWFVVGLVPGAWVFIFMQIVYLFLHRKDKKLLSRAYHPKYVEEHEYGGFLAFVSTYVAAFILIALHVCNVITIPL